MTEQTEKMEKTEKTEQTEKGGAREIEMRPVQSSHVDAIGYDPEKRELHVSYRGRRAVYAGVDAEVAQTVEDSASIGQALHTWVRGNYEFRYLRPADDDAPGDAVG